MTDRRTVQSSLMWKEKCRKALQKMLFFRSAWIHQALKSRERVLEEQSVRQRVSTLSVERRKRHIQRAQDLPSPAFLCGWYSFPTPRCNPQVCSQMWWIWTLESHRAFGTLIIPDLLWLLASPHILSSFYHAARRTAFKYIQSWPNKKYKIEVLFDTFGTTASTTPWCNLGYHLDSKLVIWYLLTRKSQHLWQLGHTDTYKCDGHKNHSSWMTVALILLTFNNCCSLLFCSHSSVVAKMGSNAAFYSYWEI